MNVLAQPASYQLDVYEELRQLASDFFDYDWTQLAATPRTNVLLCGSTGVGKTFLCRQLARDLHLPMIDLEYSNWVVTGASMRGALQTLRMLYRFVEQNDSGLITLDELDKIGDAAGNTDWTRSVHLELFSILDRRVLPGIIEGIEHNDDKLFTLSPDEIERRLRCNYFVLGCGAWQHLWRRPPVAGFSSAQSHEQDAPTYEELSATVRPEILNRFRTPALLLPPLSRQNYVTLLDDVLTRLPPEFGPLMRAHAAQSLDDAVGNQRGYRWIENLVADAIRTLRLSAQSDKTRSPLTALEAQQPVSV
jgi:SpoVK/Ycf46/Vps4 family AAA+-type ATPase